MRIAIVENSTIANIAEFGSLDEAIAFYPDEVCINVDSIFCDIGWHYEDGQFTEPVVVISLAEAIAQTQTNIQDYAQSLLAAAVAGASDEERDTWFGKKDEARLYALSDNAADAPNLLIEATAAGIPLGMLAEIVSAKAEALTAYTSHLCGKRSYHYRAVAMLTEVEAVQNYDYSQGWMPVS